MRVGSKVGEEEEVGNAKSVREHGHGKRVIEMRWLNDGKAHAYIGRHGTAPDAVVAIVRGDRKAGLGLLHLLEHPGFRYGSSVSCAGAALDEGEGPSPHQLDGIPGVGARCCIPFSVGPALEYQSMAGGGSRGRQWEDDMEGRGQLERGHASPRCESNCMTR